MVNEKKVMRETGRAARAIALKPNVAAAASTGNGYAVGAALGQNAAQYGLKHLAGVKIKGIKQKHIRDVSNRLSNVVAGKANIVNKGDLKIAGKYAAGKAINHFLKGKQKQGARAVYDRVNSTKKLVNKGDVAIGAKWVANKGIKKVNSLFDKLR